MARGVRRGDLVEVEWRDSRLLPFGWSPPKTYIGSASQVRGYHSCGYVLRSGDWGLVLAQSTGHDGNVAGGIAIPRSAIERIRVLRRSH